MQQYPHHYAASAAMTPRSGVIVSSKGLDSFASDAPTEFGGPGDKWSPESLLVAAVADCFVLSFRAIARASRMEWDSLDCDVVGTLDRLANGTQFTAFDVQVTLAIPAGVDEDKARKLLEKAERSCLITSSLKAPSTLAIELRRSE
jgi:organic hydroperoxide reductase OsmC/OhrA